MGRIGKTVILAVLFLSVSFLWADDVSPMDRDLDPWLLLEKGKGYFRDRDFATSLNYFSLAQEKGAIFPEVEYWIGRIYEEEGELVLAEEQYLKAYSLHKYLYIQDDKYEIAYRLSRLYLNRQAWDSYEDILLGLIQDEMGRNMAQVEQEHLLVRVIKERGIDELLFLYRNQYRYSLRALRELGVFYYKQGNYRSALIHNLYAVMSGFSAGADGLLEVFPEYQYPRSLEQLRDWDPLYLAEELESRIQRFRPDFLFPRDPLSREFKDQQAAIDRGLAILDEEGDPYRFSGLLYSLQKMGLRSGVYTYLKEQGFYSSLYYLAGSLYGEGFENQARELWEVLYRSENAGNWALEASMQLENPHLDDDLLIF